MPARRIERRQGGDPSGLPENLHPVLRRVYAARGVTEASELETALGAMAPPDRLTGLQAAAGLLADAIDNRNRILIVGDFDADGATSTALAIRALTAMGAASVDYLVPNRFDFGYGLSPELVEVAADYHPDVVITVDNGIACHAGVDAARAHGMQVLVTDHHLPAATLPGADVIVNPNLPDDGFPSKHLAGVGVIFYVMIALRQRLQSQGHFNGRSPPNLAELLDLVALGTVADVVTLDANNRVLVEQGLRRIRSGACCAGITALLEVAGRDPRRVVASDLGFAVGPRLNAAGRLEDMGVGIECLLATRLDAAKPLAGELDRLNRQRREIEGQMREEAYAALEQAEQRLAGEGLPAGLCVMDEGWHHGVVGLLASRLKERFHRPVIAFAPEGDEALKGSARSVAGVHIRDVLERIHTQAPALIGKFGGHAMAAGLSIPRSAFGEFERAFSAEVERLLGGAEPEGVILSDGPLAAKELTMDLAAELRAGGPWGQGFPEPVFDGHFQVVDSRIVGDRHLKLRLRPEDGAQTIDAIAFNYLDEHEAVPDGQCHAAYRLDVNDFRGRQSLQLMIEWLEF